MNRYYDNTRLSAFRKCPRRYYFRHVRHWRRDGVALALVFGGCWHAAMDVVWRNAKSPMSDKELVTGAFEAFMTAWKEEGLPTKLDVGQEEQMAPRTPGVALDMLVAYVGLRRPFLKAVDILAIERPFAVPLYADDDSILYVGRRDKDFQDEYGIQVAEHKTTTAYKKDGGFRYDWLNQWSPNAQVDGYIHSSTMDYGKRMKGVLIDGALVHKKERHFKFVPVDRRLEMLESWLMDTRYYINLINEEAFKLMEIREEAQNMTYPLIDAEPILYAFPKNTDSCQDYGGLCPFIDLCKAYPNPELLTEPPEGFLVDPWEPFEELKLSDIGLKKEEPDGN